MVSRTTSSFGRNLGSGSPSTRGDGKWKKKASLEGEVVQHPNGKHVVRKAGYTDSYHDTKEAAEKHLADTNERLAKIRAEREQHLKKFSQM